ncbi:MAG TPA: twin-arginine translocase subunit TatC, partial [Candidatus Saccharimonadia bacterium]|nr:twin-arginine translocase subunit TatC [Candidatus Saccharimonadia bacterium]
MEPQTFHDHVKELRRRLLWVIIALSASSTLVYVYRLKFISVLSKPISTPLYYTSPLGGFNLAIKISTIFGLILALPFIVYNVVKFIEPALPKNLKHSSIFRMLIFSLSLAILGAAFGYFVILPMSLHFFMGYSTGTIKPLISATEYLNYVLNIIITFALLFQ